MINKKNTGQLKYALFQHMSFLGVIVIISLLVVDLFVAFYNEKSRVEHELLDLHDAIIEKLAYSLYQGNVEIIEAQIDELAGLDYIENVSVFKNDQLFLNSSDTLGSSRYTVTFNYPISYFVNNEVSKIGTLIISSNLSKTYSTAIKTSLLFSGFSILLILLLIITTYLFLRKNLFTHLETITQHLKQMDSTNYTEPLQVFRPERQDQFDEIDELVSAFNQQRQQSAKNIQALAISQDKFYKIFDSSPDAIIITSFEDGQLLDVNKSFYRIYEFDESDEVLGKTASQLKMWSDTEDREAWKEQLVQGGQIYLRETQYRKKTGKTSDCIATCQIIDFGEMLGLVTTIRDISETKRYQSALLHSRRRLQNLAKSQEEILERERRGISREVHDELGQSFTSLKFDLSWLKDYFESDAIVKQKINVMIQDIDDSVDAVRRISAELRPAVLDDLGLIAALEWFTKDFSARTKISHKLQIDSDDLPLNSERDTAIFRISQEALTNIARHSKASTFNLKLEIIENSISLEIIDNGIGILDEEVHSAEAIGIIGMQERAANINAKLTITNNASGGTRVSLLCPLNHSN